VHGRKNEAEKKGRKSTKKIPLNVPGHGRRQRGVYKKWERDGHRGREKETGKVKTTRKASKARATCGCKKGA